MNKWGVIGTLCVILMFMGMTAKFTTEDSRNRLYDAGFNYFEIQKGNMNKTIQESLKNFESYLNSTENGRTNNTTPLQPRVESVTSFHE